MRSAVENCALSFPFFVGDFFDLKGESDDCTAGSMMEARFMIRGHKEKISVKSRSKTFIYSNRDVRELLVLKVGLKTRSVASFGGRTCLPEAPTR